MSFYIKKEGGSPLSGRIERIIQEIEVDTQRVRARLIRVFENLVQYYLKRAKPLKETKECGCLSARST